MSEIWFLALLLGAAVADQKLYTGYKVVRVTPNTPDDVAYLQSLGNGDVEIDFWIDPSAPGHPVDINLDARNFVKLAKVFKSRGMKYQIYLRDVQKAIDDENIPTSSETFSSGGYDYAKYNRLGDINTELSNIANKYSSFVTEFKIGTSYENRDMYALKIQSQKGASNKKTVFMNCGIHAREWISPATCMYMIKQFVEKYSKGDAEITAVVQKYDWIILPVFNVDGYEFTHTGKRLWRKTRSPNSGYGCKGADPNRNWNYKWGGAGTSSYPCSDIYHGRRPFSEKEVLSVAKYLYSIRNNLVAYYDIHAYSQLWLTPWSYKSALPNDYTEIKRVADIATAALTSVHGTSYRVGPPSKVLYSVAGGSIDWTYAVLGVRYSYALELRDKGQYGFLLPASQITPTGQETFKAIIAAAKAYK